MDPVFDVGAKEFFRRRGITAATPEETRAADDAPPHLNALMITSMARIQARRREAETNGVIVDGHVYDTSFESTVRLLTVLVFALRDPSYRASILLRDGNTREVGASELYRIATAISYHMQKCSAWEQKTLNALRNVQNPNELETTELDAELTIPVSDTTTPEPPEGSEPPAEFNDADIRGMALDIAGPARFRGQVAVNGAARFDAGVTVLGSMKTSSIDAGTGVITTTGLVKGGTLAATGTLTSGNASVASLNAGSGAITTTGTARLRTVLADDSTILRLSALDDLGTSTTEISQVKLTSPSWVQVASFARRKGDRPIDKVVALTDAKGGAQPAVALYEPTTNTTLGSTVGEVGATSVTVPVQMTWVENSNDCTLIEIWMNNSSNKGHVTMKHFVRLKRAT